MKKPLVIGAVIAALLAVLATPAGAAHERGDLTVGLNGANEIGTEGDKNGSGKIEVAFFAAVDNPDVVFPNQDYVCYTLTVRNVDEATGLHIHEVSGEAKNPRKDTGPVVVDLLDGSRESGDQTCVAMAPGVVDEILDDPREYYVNYHTEAQPAGAIRGQLHAFN